MFYMKKVEISKEELVKLRETMSVKEIANHYGVSVTTISRYVTKYGIGQKTDRTDIDTEQVLKYYQKGLSMNEIAEHFHCSVDTIDKRLKANGISHSRADGIRRHFFPTYEDRWSGIETDYLNGMSVKALRDKYHIRMENLKKLFAVHGYVLYPNDSLQQLKQDISDLKTEQKTRTNTCHLLFLQEILQFYETYQEFPTRHRFCEYTGRSYTNLCNTIKTYDAQNYFQKWSSIVDTVGYEKFIAEAQIVHGDMYDYSKVRYIDDKTDVCIICPEHGIFWQSPKKHLSGSGCPHPKCVAERRKQTMLKRYGVTNAMYVPEFKQKLQDTCMEHYGVSNPMHSEEVKEILRQTVRREYGVDYTCQADTVKGKRQETCQKRYGGNGPLASQEVRDKSAVTMLEKYGVRHALQNPELLEKAHDTCNNHYGVLNPMHDDDVKQQVTKSKQVHDTFCSSKPEDELYDLLRTQFGVDDVCRQYHSDLYPFACDFYIPSRNLYIELNAMWSHGGHWYGTYESDEQVLQKYQIRAQENQYYQNAIVVWTDKDVEKRQTAAKNYLNYIVFWDHKLRDAILWFAMGCPNGQDWARMYSWLPQRQTFDIRRRYSNLSKTTMYSVLAKQYQQSVFYEIEMRLWQENPEFCKFPLQMWLYLNRYQYVHKLPDELSDFDILRGFTIAGIHKGYTVFDVRLMQQVLDKYDIHSVYDPCAGWGERMLCCHANQVEYLGVDVNEKLLDGYERMIQEQGLQNCSIRIEDSSIVDLHEFTEKDAVITCPPYGNTEIYSAQGAEHYDESDFLEWWQKVVENSLSLRVRYFCFQINQKWKKKLSNIVENCGFRFVEELTYPKNRVSHMNRVHDAVQKKEYESMLVYERM